MTIFDKTSVIFDPIVTGAVCQSVDQLTDSNEKAAAALNLSAVFPASVIVRERLTPGEPAELAPSEAEFVAKSRPKRVREYAAGRACARAALAALGVRDFALLPAPDRQPRWPPGIVGSITHTSGLCMAAVAWQKDMLGIGLDCEVVGAPTPDIWPTICREEEMDWVQSLPATLRPAAVTLVFSAKEAFYKCQYPVVGEWLDFEDLRIEVAEWGGNSGSFTATATRSLKIEEQVRLPLTGRYAVHGMFLTAGICIAAPGQRAVPGQCAQ